MELPFSAFTDVLSSGARNVWCMDSSGLG